MCRFFHVSLALLVISLKVQALPTSSAQLEQLMQWNLSQNRVAHILVGLDSDFATEGASSAGSVSIFLAATFSEAVSTATNQPAVSLAATDSLIDGFARSHTTIAADIVASGSQATAQAFTQSSGTSLFPAIALNTNASSRSSGSSSTWSLAAGGQLASAGQAHVDGASFADTIVIDDEESLVTTSASSLISSWSSALTSASGDLLDEGDSHGSAVASAIGETLAISMGALETIDENATKGEQTTTNTGASTADNLLLANGAADSLANFMSKLVVASIDTLITADSSASSAGFSVNDAFSAMTGENLALTGSTSAFLGINTSDSFAQYSSPDSLLFAGSGVETMVFGYTESWITVPLEGAIAGTSQEIPAPDSSSMILLGLVSMFLFRKRYYVKMQKSDGPSKNFRINPS